MDNLTPKWGVSYAHKAEVFANTPWWKREAEQALAQLPASGKVLDLGCNTGVFLKKAERLNPNLELFGVDVNTYALEQAAKQVDAHLSTSVKLLGVKDLDYVVCIHTINQIADLDTVLNEVWQSMKAGAGITVITHNPLVARLRKPLNLFNGYQSDATMAREPTLGELKQLMYEYGFECKRVYFFGKGLVPFLRRRIIYHGVKPNAFQ